MGFARKWQIILTGLHRRLTDRQYLVLASIVVGVLSGLAGITVKLFVHWIGATLHSLPVGYWFALFPVIGVSMSVLYIHYVIRDDLKTGAAEIVYSIAKHLGIIKVNQIPAQMITSGLTIGFGGSAGLESPMVSTGAAIGSTSARLFGISSKDRTVLLAAGAAAGIASAFNSPIAGVLFAVEVLVVDIAIPAFIPLILAAASGALLSKIILKEGVLLTFSLQTPFDYTNVPYYVILGVLCGFLSIYYSRSFSYLQRKVRQIRQPIIRITVGCAALALLLVLFPSLSGEGYDSIKMLAGLSPGEVVHDSVLFPLLKGPGYVLTVLGIIALIKVVAVALTLGAGGNGGNFAPSLFVGAYTGFFFARAANMFAGTSIPESNFTLVAMAGILSGIFYAPLTAVFLIAELTGGYGLMIPLMIVSAASLAVARYFEPHSMEARKISDMLRFSIHDRDRYVLSRLEVESMIEVGFKMLRPDGKLGDLVKAISTSTRNIFPVVDVSGVLVGVVRLDAVRDIMFERDLYQNVTIESIMQRPSIVISRSESVHEVLQKFDSTGDWNLPVTDNGIYLGFLSKSTILSRYRNELVMS